MTARALINGRGQKTFEPGKVFDLATDIVQMMDRDLAHFVATSLFGAPEVEKRAYFSRRKAEFSRSLDKFERAQVPSIENPMAPCGSAGRIEQTDLFEVPDGFDVNTGSTSKLAYGPAGHVEFP